MTDIPNKPETPCWEWPGVVNSAGYGVMQVNGKSKRAHRELYERVIGPIPKGMVLDHLCRNRKCANPWHLEPVSLEENILRGTGLPAENARKTHCIRGHEFTSENTRILRGAERECRECAREATRERMRRFRFRKASALTAALKGDRS